MSCVQASKYVLRRQSKAATCEPPFKPQSRDSHICRRASPCRRPPLPQTCLACRGRGRRRCRHVVAIVNVGVVVGIVSAVICLCTGLTCLDMQSCATRRF